jgi:hypothetical protein
MNFLVVVVNCVKPFKIGPGTIFPNLATNL